MEPLKTNKELAEHYLYISKDDRNSHEKKMEYLAMAQVHATLHVAEVSGKVVRNTTRGEA